MMMVTAVFWGLAIGAVVTASMYLAFLALEDVFSRRRLPVFRRRGPAKMSSDHTEGANKK